MGEAKRKRDALKPHERAAIEVQRALANQGRAIEGGFAALCANLNLKPDDPNFTLLRMVYLSGADHVYTTMLNMSDAGDDVTAADMKRMEALHNEVEANQEVLRLYWFPAEGGKQ